MRRGAFENMRVLIHHLQGHNSQSAVSDNGISLYLLRW
jgi:hypothetical protein